MTTLTQQEIEYNTELLVQAISYGDLDEVKRLIPISDPKTQHSEALQWAAKYGYTDIVKMLIPVSNPKALNSWALLLAVENGHIEIVKLLIPVSDYQLVVEELLDDNKDIALLQQPIDEYEAVLQKERLNNTLTEVVETKNNSNKRKM